MKCKIVSGFLSGSSGVISGNGTYHGRKVFIVDIHGHRPYLFYPEELDLTGFPTRIKNGPLSGVSGIVVEATDEKIKIQIGQGYSGNAPTVHVQIEDLEFA